MLNFSTKRGDTFAEVPFQINKDGIPLNLTGAIIHMQLRKSPGGTVYLNLTSVSNLGITMTSALDGAFKINEMILNLEANVYLYDIEITFPSGEVKTWISGQFTVTNDITR
tara:strand:+ start:1842 stop:2174 length:333 start_codon:yes stop_codon:yes gene_type:complete